MPIFENQDNNHAPKEPRVYPEVEEALAKIDTTMHAIRLHAPDGPASLRYEQIETPTPKREEALVQIYAAAITRDELKWPVDRLPAIPSYEFSGVVAALGSEGDGLKIGDAVYALCGFDHDGAAADYAVVPQQYLAPKPRTLDYIECAAIPLAALAAWQGLFDHGDLQKNQRVLIHGAAGGVGSYAVQLAHHRGAYVIGTASSKNAQGVWDLGADQVIDHTSSRFEDTVESVDLVFDTVGGDRLRRSPAVLHEGGRLVTIAEEPPPEVKAAKGISAVYFIVKPSRDQLVQLAALIDSGVLRPTIDIVFPLSDARSAFQRSLDEHQHGKIVLSIADDQRKGASK